MLLIPISWWYLNGVLDGSNRALCLSRAGPGAVVSSWRGVAIYLEGGPPKISSLFCSTCSQRCSVFSTAWHRGEPTGRSVLSRGEKATRLAKTGSEKWGGTYLHPGRQCRTACVVYSIVYLIDHILPLGKRTWGWPTPAEPLPDASNTNWEGEKAVRNQITILNINTLHGSKAASKITVGIKMCSEWMWCNFRGSVTEFKVNGKAQTAVNICRFTLGSLNWGEDESPCSNIHSVLCRHLYELWFECSLCGELGSNTSSHSLSSSSSSSLPWLSSESYSILLSDGGSEG